MGRSGGTAAEDRQTMTGAQALVRALEDAGVTDIFGHAGTALDDRGRLVSAGGRVLVVVATGADIADARERAYAHIARIDFTDGFARSDIASQARLDAIAARLG